MAIGVSAFLATQGGSVKHSFLPPASQTPATPVNSVLISFLLDTCVNHASQVSLAPRPCQRFSLAVIGTASDKHWGMYTKHSGQ